MAWYDTGTVNVANGSTAVVGVGTNFIAGAQVGEGFYGPDNRLYEIQAIVSATSLTLADVYLGTTQTGQGYKIVPTQSLVAALATQVSTLISDFQGVVDEAGSGKFADGTAASAGITFTLDQDTGIFRPAANQIGFTTAGVQRAKISNAGLDVTGDLTVDTSTLHVDSANNRVGIGASNPSAALDVEGPSATAIRLTRSNAVSNYAEVEVAGGNSEQLTIKSNVSNQASGFTAFDMGGSEAMRIDASGRLGIGTSSPSAALDVVGDIEVSGGVFFGGAVPANSMLVGTTTAQDLKFGRNNIVNLVLTAAQLRPAVDNDMTLGGPSFRWSTVYAASGSINTSDATTKQDIEVISEAETRVALACKGLMRKFRFIDAVDKKGDDARIHFGIIAQDLQAAFANEGLDPNRYAMFCSDTWWEEDIVIPASDAVAEVLDDEGNVVTAGREAVPATTQRKVYETAEEATETATEVTRLGVRYSELLAFIIAAI